MNYSIYTLSGKALLDYLRINSKTDKDRVICFCQDFILSYNEYEDSALFYQLKQVVLDEIASEDSGCLKQIYFYIDFNDAFPLKDRRDFDALFKNGFSIDFGGKIACFLPFLSSQSQSKKRVFSFIRQDVFAPLMRRLNLDIDFEKNIYTKSLSYLTKLYAYRSLYMSSATEALRASDADGAQFFTPENIIILPEIKHNYNDPKDKVRVFTSEQSSELSESGEAVVRQVETEALVPITCFDGEGIISPDCRDLINKHLEGKMRGNSFQVRMPFLKGVLHTVDFHKFLRDKDVKGETAYVEDVFGIKRDLFKANIIIRPSSFKLCALIEKAFGDKTDVMEYYFKKIFEYNHGLYVVKTESSFHNTEFVRLSSQILSTLDLSVDELDSIVKEHIDMADAFSSQNLADQEKRARLLAIEDKPSWMKLLLKEPRFIDDPHIQTILSNHRVSRYNDIAMGRLLVRGENRFLSGDLLYFLIDLLKRIGDKSLENKLKKLEKNRIGRGGVYMPGVVCRGQEVALIRSPHLSRNEDVCTVLCGGKDYDNYLGHLSGVVLVGDRSYIPSALGGADFDGDQISIIYDKRIINACRKSGYTEIGNKQSDVPFIHIESLKGESTIKKYRYVSSQAVYNTFSNRIGEISNAAMKIAAVEYDQNFPKNEGTPKAALCTILTGNEIDSTKKGVRPYIAEVVKFAGDSGTQAAEVVKEIEKYIKIKRELESRGGKIPKVAREKDALSLPSGELSETVFYPNREHNAVSQLLYRWAEAFLEFKSGKKQGLGKKALKNLEGIFGAGEQSDECQKIFSAFMSAADEYSEINRKHNLVQEKIRENNAKINIRLKGQYDDIYSEQNADGSYADRFLRLQQELCALVDEFSVKEITELRDLLFSEAKEKFDADIFWPYSKGCGILSKNRLFERIVSLENSDLLLNFDYEGYRLLYYALDNVIVSVSRDFESLSEPINCYHDSYRKLCYQMGSEKVSVARAERKLAESAVSDLCMAELGLKESAKARKQLICRLYPPKDEKSVKAFWKMFTENQVISALGGDCDA